MKNLNELNWFKEGSDIYGLEKTQIYIKKNDDEFEVYDSVYNEDSQQWENKKIAEFYDMDSAKAFGLSLVGKHYADGGVIDVIDKYNRMNLPSEIYANKKPYTGYATFINGYSGYGSSEDDGYLIGEGLYLTDENGSIIRSKERRGLTMYIEDGKFLEISSYADGGKVEEWENTDFSDEIDFLKDFFKNHGLKFNFKRQDNNYVFYSVSKGDKESHVFEVWKKKMWEEPILYVAEEELEKVKKRWEDYLSDKMAEGGNTNSFNPRSFSLEELINYLGKNDIYVSWFLKGWTGITPASENKIIWNGTSNSLGYKQWKDKKLTISNYGNLEISKGDENIYLSVIVYELQSNSEQPYEIRLYTKDNIKELKSFSKMLIDKLKDGGNLSTETQEKIDKLQKVVDSAMIPENVKEKARLEIEKLMEKGKGQQDFEQRELNKSVLKIVDSKRISNQEQFEQIVAETLQDANYHEQAFKFASKVDKSIKTKDDWYQSKRFIGTKTTREIGIQIAQMTGWNGDKITDALEFVLKMKGFHNLADILNDVTKAEDDYPNRIETLTKNQEFYIKEIATRTVTDQRAVTEFVKDNGLTETETLNLLQGLGMKKIISIDFVTALLGNKLYEQNIVAFAKSKEAFKSEPKKEETPKVADDRLKGKNISDVSTYIPHRAIEVIVTTFNGKKVTLNGGDIFDGIYVDNKALGLEDNKTSRPKDTKTKQLKVARTQFEEETFEFGDGGYVKPMSNSYRIAGKYKFESQDGFTYEIPVTYYSQRSGEDKVDLWIDTLTEYSDGTIIQVKFGSFGTNIRGTKNLSEGKSVKVVSGKGNFEGKLTKIDNSDFNYKYYPTKTKMAHGGKVEIDSKKIGLAKRLDIKNWYLKTYPTDNLGKEINDNVSFWSLYTFMSQRYNVYSVLGVSDSIVRERVFEKLSEILGIKYDYIYKMWLKSSDEYSDGGELQSEIDYIDNRIYNLEQLKMVANPEEQDYFATQIKGLEKEKAELITKMESGDAPKKKGWFFKQGGQTATQKKKIEKVMRDFKMGTLKSSSGDKVTDREQAIAIALSEAGLGGWSHKSNSSNSDKKLISDKISEIKKFSGVELVADDYFKGIYEANGKKYFNVEIKDRVSESNIISKLQGAIKSKVISKVEPNGVKRLAIYF